LCLNAPDVKAVAWTVGRYVGSSTVLALLSGESFALASSSSRLRVAPPFPQQKREGPLLSPPEYGSEQQSHRLAGKHMGNLP